MDTLILRSMMSAPGIRERFIEKARAIPADILCFDLEDSVAWDDKPAARDLDADDGSWSNGHVPVECTNPTQ